jgi:hypothetical protein
MWLSSSLATTSESWIIQKTYDAGLWYRGQKKDQKGQFNPIPHKYFRDLAKIQEFIPCFSTLEWWPGGQYLLHNDSVLCNLSSTWTEDIVRGRLLILIMNSRSFDWLLKAKLDVSRIFHWHKAKFEDRLITIPVYRG